MKFGQKAKCTPYRVAGVGINLKLLGKSTKTFGRCAVDLGSAKSPRFFGRRSLSATQPRQLVWRMGKCFPR